MTDADVSCEYVLDPNDPQTWGGSPGDQCYIDTEILNEHGVWTCPHEVADGESRCQFHLPVDEKDNEETVDAFVDTVLTAMESTDPSRQERNLQFIGARFGTFNLGNNPKRFETDGTRIDLSYSRFEDSLDLSGSTFDTGPVYFIGTRFQGTVSFDDVTFEDYVAFLAAEFEGRATFDSTTFSDEGDFRSATFRESTSFCDGDFGNRADFSSVEFVGDATFDSVEIEGDADFSRTKFKMDFSLASATIQGNADFMAMKVVGEADFESLAVTGDTTLQFAEFEGVDSSGLL